MRPSSARGLAGGGALLVAFSLLTPWYVLVAGGLSGEGKSGASALGWLALILVALALAAGWSGTSRVSRFLPVVAAGVLALFVLAKLISPPAATGVFGTSVAQDVLSAQLQNSVASALSASVKLHYTRAWGIWLALIGAVMVVAGTTATAMDPDR